MRHRRPSLALAAVVTTVALGSLALSPVGANGRPSLDIHYVPTPPAVVDAMLDLAKVTAGDVLYDLGSGDGRIVIAAAKRFGVKGVGVELDRDLNRTAERAARKAGVAQLTRFEARDLFKADLSAATVVTLYLSPTTNLRLREKLRRELTPGTRIVSHRFDMGDWAAEQERVVGTTRIFLWTIGPKPAR